MEIRNVDYYYESIKCWNCGKIDDCEISKGTTIEDYNDRNKCSNCGCHRRLK